MTLRRSGPTAGGQRCDPQAGHEGRRVQKADARSEAVGIGLEQVTGHSQEDPRPATDAEAPGSGSANEEIPRQENSHHKIPRHKIPSHKVPGQEVPDSGIDSSDRCEPLRNGTQTANAHLGRRGLNACRWSHTAAASSNGAGARSERKRTATSQVGRCSHHRRGLEGSGTNQIVQPHQIELQRQASYQPSILRIGCGSAPCEALRSSAATGFTTTTTTDTAKTPDTTRTGGVHRQPLACAQTADRKHRLVCGLRSPLHEAPGMDGDRRDAGQQCPPRSACRPSAFRP